MINYAVIDVGSNSVRLAAYHYDEENKALSCFLNEREMLGLASYISNEYLTSAGVEKLAAALKKYKALAAQLQVERLYTLATASIRNVENTQEIVAQIDAMTGIRMRVLSGDEEANYDFMGAIPEIRDNSGVIVDIGGGSTEIILFENREVSQAVSIPVGSLQLYATCVKGFIPTPEERKQMKACIEEQIARFAWPERKKFSVLYGIGGTCRCTQRLAEELFAAEQNGVHDQTVSFHIIRQISKSIKRDLQEGKLFSYLKQIYKAVPERLFSVIPGLMILSAIAKQVGTQELKICAGGVREGFLYRDVIGK